MFSQEYYANRIHDVKFQIQSIRLNIGFEKIKQRSVHTNRMFYLEHMDKWVQQIKAHHYTQEKEDRLINQLIEKYSHYRFLDEDFQSDISFQEGQVAALEFELERLKSNLE